MSYLNETVAGDAGPAERNTWGPRIGVRSWQEQIPGSFRNFIYLFIFYFFEKLLLRVTFYRWGRERKREKDKITELKASSPAPTERRCGLTRCVSVARAGAAELSAHAFSAYRSRKQF